MRFSGLKRQRRIATLFSYVLLFAIGLGANQARSPLQIRREQSESVPPPYQPNARIVGKIVAARADSMETLMQAWAGGFSRFHPETRIELRRDTRLSAEAFDALLDGTAQIAPFVRELFPSEMIRFQRKFGYAPFVIAVAGGSYATKSGTHAVAIYVHGDNPLKQLTLAQLHAIFAEGGAITTWGQLGLKGEWANEPINLYGMLRHRATGDPPGIVNFLRQRLLDGAEFKSSLREKIDSDGISALDAIVRAVAADRFAIGYSGFANIRSRAKASRRWPTIKPNSSRSPSHS